MASMLARARYPRSTSPRVSTARRSTTRSAGRRLSLYAGRLGGKGIEDALAASHASRHVPPVIAGDGPLGRDGGRGECAVTFVGRVTRRSCRELHARRFASPSREADARRTNLRASSESTADGEPSIASRRAAR